MQGENEVWLGDVVRCGHVSGLREAVLMTAGHDEIRGSSPDQKIALEAHDSAWVFPIPGSNRFAITSLGPSHFGVPVR